MSDKKKVHKPIRGSVIDDTATIEHATGMLDNDVIATVYKIAGADLAAQSVQNLSNVEPHLAL